MKHSLHHQSGYAILLIASALLILVTSLSLILTGSVHTQIRSFGNEYRTAQAFQAAQAGVDYAIVYLDENRATVTNGQTLTGNVTGGDYSAVLNYSPNLDKITIVSTGTSEDDTATQVISQQVVFVPDTASANNIDSSTMAIGNVELSGSGSIINNDSSSQHNITNGGLISITGGAAQTLVNDTPISTQSGLGEDVEQSHSTLASMTTNDLETQYLSQPIEDFDGSQGLSYTGTTSEDNYNDELNGLTGETVWITQTTGSKLAVIDGQAIVGSLSNPVTLFVDGNVRIAGNAKIHGNIIATGDVVLTGAADVQGFIYARKDLITHSSSSTGLTGAGIAGGNISVSGSGSIIYNRGVLDTVLSSFPPASSGVYAKVPGSWNDLGL